VPRAPVFGQPREQGRLVLECERVHPIPVRQKEVAEVTVAAAPVECAGAGGDESQRRGVQVPILRRDDETAKSLEGESGWLRARVPQQIVLRDVRRGRLFTRWVYGATTPVVVGRSARASGGAV
jgi:hypothetical protein